MDRHFLLPVTIAAALHGLLLGLPRAPIAHVGPASRPSADTGRLPEAITMVPDDPPRDDETASRSGGGDPNDVRHLPDAPTASASDLFTVRVAVESTRLNTGPVSVIPAKPFGDGGPDLGGSGGIGPISYAGLDRSPRTRVQIAPDYPPGARRDGREGEVTVEFVVDETGRVHDPRVVGSSDSIFDDSAVRAVAKWRFEPGTVRGVVVRFKMAVPILFRLNNN